MFAVISPSEPNAPAAGKQTAKRRAPHGAAPAAAPLQRSVGSVDLVISRSSNASRVARAFQQGSMKVRFPNVGAGDPPEAVLINTSGGLTGGDLQHLAVTVAARAAAVLTTQACERIYRSSGEDARITVHLTVGADAKLHWLPQPLIFFDGGRLKRETHVELSCDAHFLAVESVVFGRLASGETVKYGAVSDAWFVRRAGRLIHAERFAADGAMDSILGKPAVLAGNRAMALIRYIAPDVESRVQDMRTLLDDCACDAAASAWNGMLLARLHAPDAYALSRGLTAVLNGFRGTPLPKAWLL